MPTHDDRMRLARSLSEFWSGGDGPPHDDISKIFDFLDLTGEAISIGSKRDRIYAAVMAVSDQALPGLVAHLVELLSEGEYLKIDDPPCQATVRFRKGLRPFGLRLTDEGEVLGGASLGVEPLTMLTLPALREQIQRIKLALSNDDSALLLGSSKKLLETTSKVHPK